MLKDLEDKNNIVETTVIDVATTTIARARKEVKASLKTFYQQKYTVYK